MKDLASSPFQIVETETRRALGAIQLVDATSKLPLPFPTELEAVEATIEQNAPQTPLRVRHDMIRIHRNLSGLHVLTKAPFFDQYTATFDSPSSPTETNSNPLRVRIHIRPQSSNYLPRSVVVDLPRDNDPTANNAIARPIPVALYPSPASARATASTTLRVSVTRSGSPFGGVLVSVYNAPRQNGAAPIARGMSTWKSPLVGEALVVIPDIPRFRPGSGNAIIETSQEFEVEATFDSNFDPDSASLPDPDLLDTSGPDSIQSVNWATIQPSFVIRPDSNPASIQAGREHIARFVLP